MNLQVPTYQKMRCVMFYDVFMKLAHTAVRAHYESAAAKKMRASLSKLMNQNGLSADDDIVKEELDNQFKATKKDKYELEIMQIKNEFMKEKNPSAEMVRDLIKENKALTTKFNHIVDTNVKMLGEEYFTQKIAEGYDIPVEIYSTAHTRSCKRIYKLIGNYLDKKKEREQSLLHEGGEGESSRANLVIVKGDS